jgi:hypothetical protein
VPSQAVYEFRAPAVRAAAAYAKSHFPPGRVVSICDSPAFSRTSEEQKVELKTDGLGCARGLRSAFLFEVGMVVLAYGVWHFWHLAR